MDIFIRTVTFVSRAAGVIGALLIGLAVLVICDMVIERYVLNLTTIWQIDAVTYCVVGATFISSSYVLMTRGHVNVDILPLHAGPRARYWLALTTSLVAFAFCVAIFVLCTIYWYTAFTENWLSNTVWRARLWIPYLSMPIGLGLVVLQYLVELISLVTGRSAPFGIAEKQSAEDVILAQAHQALGDSQ
ncbi:MAG TPA: TRAP transporter small permease [Bradyrhizobium sp.]|nr:TRAP transporter small permease [Bradyrhizobium sp.]